VSSKISENGDTACRYPKTIAGENNSGRSSPHALENNRSSLLMLYNKPASSPVRFESLNLGKFLSPCGIWRFRERGSKLPQRKAQASLRTPKALPWSAVAALVDEDVLHMVKSNVTSDDRV
jgi:hypothetical protein